MGTATWKTRDETFHGSKWGYVVFLLVVLVFLSLIWIIFAALKGYPFAELIPPSSSLMIVLVFLLFFVISGKTLVTGGWGGFFSFVVNPVFMALSLSLIVAISFFMTGIDVFFMTLVIALIIAFTVFLYTKGLLSFTLNSMATLVFALSIIVYVAILFLVGSGIPAINIAVAALALVLLIAFFPFAIFLVDMFTYEHE